jgi:CheY-like chemotaxis protein
MILEDLGYKVRIAGSGQEAIEKYSIRSGKKFNKIDMVIVDVTLPDMNADKLCDRLKRINPGVSILLSSESTPDKFDKPFPTQAANGFIQKPFNIFEISSILRAVLDSS